MKKKNDKLLGARLVIWELLLGAWVLLIAIMLSTEQPLEVAVFWFAVGAIILWRFIALWRRYFNPEARAERKERQEKSRQPVSAALVGTNKAKSVLSQTATFFIRYADGRTGTEVVAVNSKRFNELAVFLLDEEEN